MEFTRGLEKRLAGKESGEAPFAADRKERSGAGSAEGPKEGGKDSRAGEKETKKDAREEAAAPTLDDILRELGD
ncbi:MAG: hypothetical protein ACUVV6_03085 [Thermoplasmatota archaeon]